MIAGIFLRNIKTYSAIRYIPLALEDGFCGIIGKNGVGKSTVLESIDYFFNEKSEWNCHVNAAKSGEDAVYIVPVFIVKREEIGTSGIAEYSESIWDVVPSSVNAAHRQVCQRFCEHRDIIKEYYPKDEYYILPIGIYKNSTLCGSIFESLQSYIDAEASISKCLAEIKNKYEYIYLPKDIDPGKLIRLETDELQRALGMTLHDVVTAIFAPKSVGELNRKLLEFTKKLSETLGEYEYKSPKQRQETIRKNNIYTLIIEDFFVKRKLHKKINGKALDISALSSGEKQQSIIDLYCSIISSSRKSAKKLIVGIDEPEASLHVSACFDQFEKLHNLKFSCEQILFTAHWYGFIPTIECGSILNINQQDDGHHFTIFAAQKYREDIKSKRISSLPIDISLKGLSDLTQAIITSVTVNDPYNWLICEGLSDKIYLDHYLVNLKTSKKLRIIPAGGSGEIERIFNYLKSFFEDTAIKPDIKGKVFFLTDTDSHFNRIAPASNKNLCFKRLQKTERSIALINQERTESIPTVIEDSINGKILKMALKKLSESHAEIDFIDDALADEKSAYIALNLRPSDQTKLEQFLKKKGMKTLLARTYVEISRELTKAKPRWIHEIQKYFE